MVSNFKPGCGRFAVFIQHLERKIVSRLAVEKQTDFVAEAQVLSTLPDIETQLGITLACVPAVKLDDTILKFQATEGFCERLGVENTQPQPVIWNLLLGRSGMGRCVRAVCLQGSRNTGFISNFYQMIPPPLLNQDALGRSGVHFHTGLRINLDVGKALFIKDFLYGNKGLRLIRLAKRLAKRAFGCLSERFA